MKSNATIFTFKQELTEGDLSVLSTIQSGDICFFRFVGGNSSETEHITEYLSRLKAKGVLLIGIFRFPFRYEGKKRLQTAIRQYFSMKQACDAIMYMHSDGMMEMLDPGTSVHEAHQLFDSLEEAPIRALEELVHITGEMNIDVHDLHAFFQNPKGPIYIRTFEGDSFDEPLKYTVSSPHLPSDFADGEQLMIHIGCSKHVDMTSFQQINLRLNDLFHKAELFKLGTYTMEEPGKRISITLLVTGLQDPYPRPETMNRFYPSKQWLQRKWKSIVKKDYGIKWVRSSKVTRS
jgi:cell division protein FtsZ